MHCECAKISASERARHQFQYDHLDVFRCLARFASPGVVLSIRHLDDASKRSARSLFEKERHSALLQTVFSLSRAGGGQGKAIQARLRPRLRKTILHLAVRLV